MKLLPIDVIPEIKQYNKRDYFGKRLRKKPYSGWHDNRELIDEFKNGSNTVVEVNVSEAGFKTGLACYKSLWAFVTNNGYRRNFKVVKRNNRVFLVKKEDSKNGK